jgi:lipid-A-disaccharide synthase
MPIKKKIFLIAGEASGDLQGAHLLRALKKLYPDLECRGLGGPMMAQEGVQLICDLTKESVLGLGDVLRKYFWFAAIFKKALREVELFKPDAIILIDYPGFNLRFAKKIKKRFPVIYYISPQIWAWGARRIHTIRKTVTHMIVFFEFEKKLYDKAKVPATWVGHPLVDVVKPTKSRDELRKEFLKQPDFKLVTLFPGSRHTEVKRILPEMLKTARIIQTRHPKTQFSLSESPTLPQELYEKMISEFGAGVTIQTFRARAYDLLSASDFAMITSGTATLEATLSTVPFVIFYKTAQSTFFLGRWLIQIPFIGLVNVVAGRKVVPEFIQHEIRPVTIAQEATYLLEHDDLRDKMIEDLKEVQSKLGPSDAARRAAEAVLKII